MAITIVFLVILCIIAAVIPLVSMWRYDAAVEPQAREVVSRAPAPEANASYNVGVLEAIRSLLLPASGFAIGLLTAAALVMGASEPPKVDEAQLKLTRERAQLSALRGQLTSLQQVQQEMASIRSKSKDYEMAFKKLQESVDRDRARVQAELEVTFRRSTF